jgi:DedD protein
MDSRAKQRLTGAVILVALFVLLVPELLTGPKHAQAPAGADEGLRRYTIDLDAPAPTSTDAAPAQPAVSLPPSSTTPDATRPLARGEPAAPAADPPAGTAAPAAASRVEAPAAVPTPAPAPTEPATRPPAPRVEPAKPSRTGEPRSFVVQLGSFGSRENAERLVRDMTAKGFTTFVAPITTNGRELYRVRVGPTRDRASAEALATQLKRVGQSGSIVPIP